MFVHYFTHISRPFELLEPVFSDTHSRWLPRLVEEAYESGEGIRTTVGIGKHFALNKEVVVNIAAASRSNGRTLLPLRVEATGATNLFPRLEVELELAPVGPQITQLSLHGSYRPPLGSAGALLDRALLHRVAEAVVKNFVEQVVATLELGATEADLSERTSSWTIDP